MKTAVIFTIISLFILAVMNTAMTWFIHGFVVALYNTQFSYWYTWFLGFFAMLCTLAYSMRRFF